MSRSLNRILFDTVPGAPHALVADPDSVRTLLEVNGHLVPVRDVRVHHNGVSLEAALTIDIHEAVTVRAAMPEADRGKPAYDAYCRQSNGKSLVSGAPLPAWPDLPPTIRAAWNATYDAIVKET